MASDLGTKAVNLLLKLIVLALKFTNCSLNLLYGPVGQTFEILR